MKITRRDLLKISGTSAIAGALIPDTAREAAAAPLDAPLPSWNDGPAKTSILAFVRDTTEKGSPKYVEPKDRIATFDQDGTLWTEQPIYAQAAFALGRLAKLAPHHPEWKTTAPYKSVISGDHAAIAAFAEKEWVEILAVTHTGMSMEDFRELVRQWITTAKAPRFDRLYTECIYQPMLEVMDYLRSKDFRVYIVTGGGQEFVREYAAEVYGVEPENVVGSAIGAKYDISSGKPMLMREPKLFFIDDGPGKAVGINMFIGKRPRAAFGNSDGDRQMLEYTQGGDGARLMMLVHHDDGVREYAYGPGGGLPNTHVGTFSDALFADAHKQNWTIISMKNDWKRIYPSDK